MQACTMAYLGKTSALVYLISSLVAKLGVTHLLLCERKSHPETAARLFELFDLPAFYAAKVRLHFSFNDRRQEIQAQNIRHAD